MFITFLFALTRAFKEGGSLGSQFESVDCCDRGSGDRNVRQPRCRHQGWGSGDSGLLVR